MRHSLQLSETEPVSRAPMEEATTGGMSMSLSPVAAVLAAEVEEEAVVTAVEAAEAVEAEATTPALIACPLMESISLIPFAVLLQTNGTSSATMAANRYSACETMPTVNSLLLEEAEEEEEEAGAARLQL